MASWTLWTIVSLLWEIMAFSHVSQHRLGVGEEYVAATYQAAHRTGSWGSHIKKVVLESRYVEWAYVALVIYPLLEPFAMLEMA